MYKACLIVRQGGRHPPVGAHKRVGGGGGGGFALRSFQFVLKGLLDEPYFWISSIVHVVYGYEFICSNRIDHFFSLI